MTRVGSVRQYFRPLVLLVGYASLSTLATTRLAASNPFDGIYSGTETMTRGGGPSVLCTIRATASVTVSDGQFTYVYDPGAVHIAINVKIAADGSVRGTQRYEQGGQDVAIVRGQMTGNTPEADIGGRACQYHASLKKQP
jgi:hypothetical protein